MCSFSAGALSLISDMRELEEIEAVAVKKLDVVYESMRKLVDDYARAVIE